MLIRSILPIFFIFTLTSCSHFHKSTERNPAPHPKKTSVQHPTELSAPFTRVYIDGDVDVNLHTGARKSYVKLYGSPENAPYIVTNVQNGVLRIFVSKKRPFNGPISADIYTKYLVGLQYYGTGKIVGNNIRSGSLDLALKNHGTTNINGQIILNRLLVAGSGQTNISGLTGRGAHIRIKDSSQVHLNGTLNVASINLSGKSALELYWVQSNNLRIRAKNKSLIKVAGVTNVLDVVLKNKAHFNGHYLRAQDVFVKTYNKSVADITALKTQHTLASNTSNIYFYNPADIKTDFMAHNGAVLDMQG